MNELAGSHPIAAAHASTLERPAVQLAVLALAAASGIYARTALGPLQETLRVAAALSDNEVALLQGPALAIPAILGAVPLGLAIARCSRVRLLWVAMLLNLIGTLATAMAPTFLTLFIARCMVGLAAPATGVLAYSLLADLYPPAQRGRATMVIVLGQVAGSSGAFAVGGELLTMSAVGGEWRAAILWMACALAPASLLAFAMREPTRTDVLVMRDTSHALWPELWRHKVVIGTLIAGMAMVNLADGAALVWAAPTLARGFDLPADRVGAIMGTVLLVSGVCGPFVAGPLADLCQRAGGPRRTVQVLGALAALSILVSLFGVVANVSLATVMLTLFITIGVGSSVMVTAVTTVAVSHELRGLCISIQFAAGSLFGFGLAPLTVSLLSGALGGPQAIGQALAVVCSVTSALGAAAFFFGAKRFASARAASVRAPETAHARLTHD